MLTQGASSGSEQRVLAQGASRGREPRVPTQGVSCGREQRVPTQGASSGRQPRCFKKYDDVMIHRQVSKSTCAHLRAASPIGSTLKVSISMALSVMRMSTTPCMQRNTPQVHLVQLSQVAGELFIAMHIRTSCG